MITINIQDLTFHAFHGVHATEREIGGKYVVQIEMLADVNASCQTDDLAAVSYTHLRAHETS